MSAHESQPDEVNEVTLVGRLSQPAEEQVLPSGDELWKFRVIVGRHAAPAATGDASTPSTASSGRSARLARSRPVPMGAIC